MILGIDYGKKKIGLAISDLVSKLADPLEVIKFDLQEDAIEKIEKIVSEIGVKKIVLGISEGKTAKETKVFGDILQKKLNLPIIYFDETLSTQLAQQMSINAGIKRKKRKDMEDAFAAALILQSYLDQRE